MRIVTGVVLFVRAMFASRAAIAAENLALRHQLGVLQRSVKRPQLRQRDRIFWALLSRFWSDWHSSLMIVKPETVIRWHRDGFKLYWHWKSRGKPGRPKIDAEIRNLIRRMCRENATWGGASSEGWRVQRELVPSGQESGPCSLGGRGGWKRPFLKPTDEAIERMVSESAGRNEDERMGGSESG